MNRLFPSTVCAVLFALGLASTAFATASMEFVDFATGSTLYFADNGAVSCTGPDCATAIFPATDQNAFHGQLSLSGVAFDGYVFTTATGASNSPGCTGVNGPNCANTTDLNAINTSGVTSTLSVYFADTGFNPTGVTGLSVGFSTPGETGTSAIQTAYATTGNINPLGSGVLTPTAGLAVCGTPNLKILAVAIPGTNVGTNCAAPGAPYSLEIAETFTAGAGEGFNLNGTIAGVPEPASIALFGTVLALCASGLRRRRKLS